MKRSILLAAALAAATSAAAAGNPAMELARKYNCLACHAPDHKIVGPAYRDVAARYKGQNVAARLFAKVRNGGAGVWGQVPMPPNPAPSDAELKEIIAWILAGAK